LDILRACEMFRPDEIDVADEILEESIRDGAKAGYRIMVAEHAGHAVGWACYGLVPLTDASYDLYWIAVAPAQQNAGIGRQLLAECEETINALGGRWLLAETSSTALYDSTRAFYARCGFQIVTSVPDYYRAGDGLVTFGKRLENTALRSH
jgi:ribosomal protein S18 acetylase RimI-like enzyme